MLDFPATPTDGQLFAAPNGVTYQWNAAATLWNDMLTAGAGDPTAPTQPIGDNDNSIATTAFVKLAMANAVNAKWYGNDGAAIIAAIAAAHAAGVRTVYIPDGIWDCNAEIVLPDKYAMRLLGQSVKGTILKAVAPFTSGTPVRNALRLISTGYGATGADAVTGVTGGEISNMTIDGGHVVHEGIRLWRAREWALTNMLVYRIKQGSVGDMAAVVDPATDVATVEPSLDTDNRGKAIVLGGYSNTLGNYLSNITILYEQEDYLPAERPWYGIVMIRGYATDNLVENCIVKNALHSCVYDDVFGGNMYTGFHPFGYPVGYAADDEGAVVMATIAGTTMTVTSVIAGVLKTGQPLYDYVDPPDPEIIAPGTILGAQLTGTTGGTGTYSINISHTVPTSTRIRAERQVNYIATLDYRPKYGLFSARGFVNVDNCYFDTLAVAGIHLGNAEVEDEDLEAPPEYFGHDNMIVSTRHTSWKRLNECVAIEFDPGITRTVVSNIVTGNMGNPTGDQWRFLGTGAEEIGTGVRFMNNLTGDPLRATMVKDLVNYLDVVGGKTGNDVIIRTFGDTDTGIRYQTAGTGTHIFEANNAKSVEIYSSGPMVNWMKLRGGIASDPVFIVADGPGNVDIRLLPKGTGTVSFGTRTATSDVPISGYITITDAGGVARKLAVIT